MQVLQLDVHLRGIGIVTVLHKLQEPYSLLVDQLLTQNTDQLRRRAQPRLVNPFQTLPPVRYLRIGILRIPPTRVHSPRKHNPLALRSVEC